MNEEDCETSRVRVSSVTKEYIPGSGCSNSGDDDHEEEEEDRSTTDEEESGDRKLADNDTSSEGPHINESKDERISNSVIRFTHTLPRKNYVAYRIQFVYAGRYWTIARRYRQFARNHKRLLWEGIVPKGQLPELPTKRVYIRWKNRIRNVIPMGRRQRKETSVLSPDAQSVTVDEACTDGGGDVDCEVTEGADAFSLGQSASLLKGDCGNDKGGQSAGAVAHGETGGELYPDGRSRLELLEEYVTALFSIPELVASSKVLHSFFELPAGAVKRLDGGDGKVDGRSKSIERLSSEDSPDFAYDRVVSVQGQFAMSMMLESELLEGDTVQRLRTYMSLCNAGSFRLCYSTIRDGWSMDTLYALTLHRFPCIILIRSLGRGAVIGAFLPVAMSPPSPDVRGDGQTFVFRLNGDSAGCFKWGVKEDDDSVFSSMSQAHQQFAICAADHIAFGGSSEYGTNAIRIDSELQSCFSGPSDTFRNPILVPEEETQPFAVENIEVFCGV